MHRFYRIALLVVFLCSSVAGSAQTDKGSILKKIPSAAQMLNNSTQGREYWIAIPPNEWDGPYTPRELELFVTASKNTEVTLEHPGTGFRVTKKVEAMKITTFTTRDGSASWSWELRDDDRASNMGIRLSADQPISVYVLNSKNVTSDGYLALPTSVWDREYMHCSFYDFAESGRKWAGGFIVIAKEDGTKVQFTLDGVNYGGAQGRTRTGRKLGDKVSVTLRRGQTYLMRGNGETMNEFDMTGTKIIANKPIGLISFHMRTMIPSFPPPNNGRDHLCEMMPPLSTWGKRYYTVEMERPTNQGDMFRVVAKEDNTKFTCRYTDLVTGVTYTWDGVLKKSGDFMEKENSWPPSTSIRGMAVWTADKPILVMQYSYSTYWNVGGGSSPLDPAMCLVVAEEQYTNSTVFQTPMNAEFVNNYVNLIAIGDTNDPTQAKLKTITVESESGGKFVVAEKHPLFLVNRIPNTNAYWIRMKLKVDAYHIYGEAPFGATMYGFNSFESYYWPAATAMNKIDQLDTLKPELDTVAQCGDYTITATEQRDQEPNAAGDSTQIDTGVNQIEIDDELSYNYRLELITDDENNIHIEPRREVFKFALKVIDRSKDAFAVYYVVDRAGNTAIDSVRYVAELVAMKPDSVLFGKVRVNTSKQLSAVIQNPTTRDIEVKNIWLKNAKVFKIITPTDFPLVVPASSELPITFEYTPDKEIKKPTDFDIDSVFAEASCGKFTLGWLRGQGVMPRLWVADWDAGKHQVGTTYCNTDEPGSLELRNDGTDTVTITEIKTPAPPFSLQSTTPALPIRIAPNEKVILKTICFSPTELGVKTLDVTFVSDIDPEDKTNKDVSRWRGQGINPGPLLTDYDFRRKRVDTRNGEGRIYLINTGDQTLNVTGFTVSKDVDNLKVTGVLVQTKDADPISIPFAPDPDVANKWSFDSYALYTSTDEELYSNRVIFEVEFLPSAQQAYSMEIKPSYSNLDDSENTVVGTAIGEGVLPEIELTGVEFDCVLRGTESPQIRPLTIRNTSTTASLTVRNVRFNDDAASAFRFEAGAGQTIPTPADPLVIPIGESRDINVRFTADETSPSFVGSGSTGDYLDEIFVDADILPGDGTSPDLGDNDVYYAETTTTAEGCDYTEGSPDIEVTNINFENVLLCNSKTDFFTVTNTGTAPLIVERFDFVGNTGAYSITDKNGVTVDASYSFTVAPNSSERFDVVFTPANAPAPYDLDVVAVSNAPSGSDNVAELRGTGYKVPVTFAVDNDAKQYYPGDPVAVKIRATSPNMADAKLNAFKMVLDYNPEALRYDGSFTPTAGLNGWDITIDADKPVRGKVTITGKQDAGAPFAQAGPDNEFLTLNFRVYLSAEETLPLTLTMQPSDLGTRVVCVDPATENGSLVLGELCVRDFRGIKYIEPFGLRQNSPNPTGDVTEIEYSIAFEVPVKLAVYNSMGEEVKVLVDGVREAGVYRLRINADELPSGSYIYRISAGPYTEARQMVITR